MTTYYNEIDPFAAQWLRNLMEAGEIAPGMVDERSIEDVTPGELLRHDRCHFFAGIGGWDYALRLAGWPTGVPIWTGSCPCQPFSTAGKRGGGLDERHLWPTWYWLIQECKPAIIFGEQVASKDGLRWLDVVFADLEAAGYSCGAADLCAAGCGAPHIRQRLFFVAIGRMADTKTSEWRGASSSEHQRGRIKETGGPSPTCELADSHGKRLDRKHPLLRKESGETFKIARGGEPNPWSSPLWLPCRDGKARPTGTVEPDLLRGFPDGIPNKLGLVRSQSKRYTIWPLAGTTFSRVGRLRGYGNAIVPQVAAEFIQAAMGMLVDIKKPLDKG